MSTSLWKFLHRRLPSGVNWRYSRFSVIRRLGDWWLPRWYGIGVLVRPNTNEGLSPDVLDRALDAGGRRGRGWNRERTSEDAK